MKKLLLILAVAGYMSACAPATNTTSSTGTTNDEASSTNTSDDAASDTETSGTGTTDTTSSSNSSSSSDMSNSNTADTTSTSSDMESTESADDSTSTSSTDMSTTESDIMGTSTTITMDQLPKAVRDAYIKLPGHANATGVKVYQVKTSQHPVVYKIEGTAGSTDYVHYFTPDGNEVKMSGTDK